MNIHSTALISNKSQIHESVRVGAYAIIEGEVEIGEGTIVEPHARIGFEHSKIKIGKNNRVHSFSYLGGAPQDTSYSGYKSQLVIGDNNHFREFVSINCGTQKDKNTTVIGNECMFMAYVHIAHDCQIGDRVVIANTTNFAGHVVVENDVKIGGACNFSQFIRLGKFSYIAGDTTANKDILPYTIAEGKWALCRATNKIGLERAGLTAEEVSNIHIAIRTLIKGNRTLEEALQRIKESCKQDSYIKNLLAFIESSKKGLAR